MYLQVKFLLKIEMKLLYKKSLYLVVKADYVTQHGLHNGSVQQQVIGRPLVFHVIDNVISGL